MPSPLSPLFVRLVHIALGRAGAFDSPPSPEAWRQLFDEACRQSLVGLCYSGVERLPRTQLPPRGLRGEWYVAVERIREDNARQRRQCQVVVSRFAEAGLRAAVLKGQAMARFWPDPTLRDAGDIDLWAEGGPAVLLRFARSLFPDRDFGSFRLHIELPVLTGTTLEVHHTPIRLSHPLYARRLARFFARRAPEVFASRATLGPEGYATCLPTARFDRVYILCHIYRHLFAEGIGLRQIFDYRCLLLQPLAPDEARAVAADIRRLGLRPVQRAVLWVIGEVFPLPAAALPDRPDPRAGRFLLREIAMTGNFGKYERRWQVDRSPGLARRFHNLPRLVSRWLSLMRHFPAEAFFEPWARLAALCTPRGKV